jgi:hypothetical protein
MHLRNYALYDQKAAIQSVGDFAACSFEFIRAQYIWKKQAFKCSVFQLMIQQDFKSNATGGAVLPLAWRNELVQCSLRMGIYSFHDPKASIQNHTICR